MTIAAAACERTVKALLELQQLQNRSTFSIQNGLRRTFGNTFCDGFLFGTLWVGLDAPKRRSCNHVGCCEAQRDGGSAEKLGAHDGMPVQGKIVFCGLGEFCLRCRCQVSGVVSIRQPGTRVLSRAITLVGFHLAIVANFDESLAAIFERDFRILPRQKVRSLLQHGHLPAPARQFLPEAAIGGVLKSPDRAGVGEIADVTKKVGDDVALVVLEWEQGGTRRDLLGPEKPLLEVLPAW